jgi:hypothetical protein
VSRKKEKVYEYVELNDRTPVQKLSLGDQVRVLFKRLTYDASQELKREDALTREELKLRADLFDFIDTATDPIRRGQHRSVSLDVSHRFEPVLDSILLNPRWTNHYRVSINRPKIEYNIAYDIKVKMEVIS